MAQSVARQAVNLQVAGSNPAGGDFAPLKEQEVQIQEQPWVPKQLLLAGFEPATLGS